MTVSGLTIAAIMGILLLVFIFSGYYLFAALGGVAILSGLAFWGPDVFQTVYFSIFKYCKDYNLLAVPLFVLMGQLLNQSGVAGRLFDNLSVALGRQRGGMAIAATLIAILFAATTLFSFVTLPVEIDASRRALSWLERSGVTGPEDHKYAVSALRSAAYTYVIAAVGSLATLLYYISIYSGSRR